MKLQFLFALLSMQDRRVPPMARCPVVRALPHAAAAANDPVLRPVPCRVWRRSPATGRMEMHWTSRD